MLLFILFYKIVRLGIWKENIHRYTIKFACCYFLAFLKYFDFIFTLIIISIFRTNFKQNFLFCFYFIVEFMTDVSHFSSALSTSTQRSCLSSLCPSPHCCLWPWALHICCLANPFTYFHPVCIIHLPSATVSLYHISIPLILFCSSV